MRLNPWFDETNHKREMRLLGHFGDADNTQNTVFCIFEPDAPGLSADAFPTEDSIYFGTRPGRRYPFLPGMARLSDEEAFKIVSNIRAEQTNGAPVDRAVIERIVWEYKNVLDGAGLAKLMRDLAAKHPAKPGADAAPRLPVMPDLAQALNIASADTRGVIAVVHPDGGDPDLEALVARLAFAEKIAGRAHLARLTADEWQRAKDEGRITGGSLEAGVAFVAPDPFGLEGEVWAEIPPDAGEERTRADLVAALDRFRKEWRKLDRKSHIRQGTEEALTWREYDPDAGGIVEIRAGSKKLGGEKAVKN